MQINTFGLCLFAAIALNMSSRAADPVKAIQESFESGNYTDPVPHEIVTQPYRVCQDLEELTARINNLYRKPYKKLIDANGVMQSETVIFKDTQTGCEIAGLTRELCDDVAHPDQDRSVWTRDGAKIVFMPSRGYIDAAGQFRKRSAVAWTMNADYSFQRPMYVQFKDPYTENGAAVKRSVGIPAKYNVLDLRDPRYAYYAVNGKLWRVTISNDANDSTAESLCDFCNDRRKFIQAISRDDKLLIQDLNREYVQFDSDAAREKYKPEIHLVDLSKRPDEKGFYYHHSSDYSLPEVKNPEGKILHTAGYDYQFHGIGFGEKPNTIGWTYGSNEKHGEDVSWTLDISNGMEGPPIHGRIGDGGSVNLFGQGESHGYLTGNGNWKVSFCDPLKLPDGKVAGKWGLWMRDTADATKLPQFLIETNEWNNGHVAGGKSDNPEIWAAHVQGSNAESRKFRDDRKVLDAIVWGDTSGKAEVLCQTFSEVRGGTSSKNGKRVWSGPDSNEYRPYNAIPRPLMSVDGTKVWFHSSMLQPTQDWVGIYVATLRRPSPPRELKLAAGVKSVLLEWQPGKYAGETKCYHLYRGDENAQNMAELAALPATDKSGKVSLTYADSTGKSGTAYTYAVTSEEWSGLESDDTSNTLAVTLASGGATTKSGPALKGWDRTPPPAVTGFTATKESDAAGQYRLRWDRSPVSDLRHYNIYFSSKGNPDAIQKRLIASPHSGMTEYLDWSAPVEDSAFYAITAVDRQGNESAPACAESAKSH